MSTDLGVRVAALSILECEISCLYMGENPMRSFVSFLLTSGDNSLSNMEYFMRFNSSIIKPVLGAAILSACGLSFA